MIQYPEIDPIAFSAGPLQVHWYGVMYLIGIVGGWFLLARRASRADAPVDRKQVDDLIFYVACGVIIGGRVGYALFYGMDQVLANPLWMFYVWEGGMSFHGGFLGVMAAMWLYGRKVNRHPMDLLDFIAPVVPIGLGMGRLGNFIGQELWGRASDVPWAMVFPKDPSGLARHPSQLYQAFLEGLVLFLILYLFSMKPRPRYAVSGLFLLFYGIFRFSVEFFRQPDAHLGFDLFGWMSRGQLLSLPMIVAGCILLFVAYQRPASSPSVAEPMTKKGTGRKASARKHKKK
jgi:phosphatidylglycerol:prolipoprotein diacylglycerol transferase